MNKIPARVRQISINATYRAPEKELGIATLMATRTQLTNTMKRTRAAVNQYRRTSRLTEPLLRTEFAMLAIYARPGAPLENRQVEATKVSNA